MGSDNVRSGAVTAHFVITDKRGKGDPEKGQSKMGLGDIKKVQETIHDLSTPPKKPSRVAQVRQHSVARISGYLTGWVQRAFEGAALGERVGWEINMIAANDGQGNQSPMWLIYAEIDGVELGSILPGAIMAPMRATYEEFQMGVANLVESLKKERSRQLSMGNDLARAAGLDPNNLQRFQR